MNKRDISAHVPVAGIINKNSIFESFEGFFRIARLIYSADFILYVNLLYIFS